MKRLLAWACLSLFVIIVVPDAFAWRGGAGAVRGPGGGGVARGPAGGVAVRGPAGGAAYRGPGGGTAYRGGAYGGGAYRGAYYGGAGVVAGAADILRRLRLSTLLIRSGFRSGSRSVCWKISSGQCAQK